MLFYDMDLSKESEPCVFSEEEMKYNFDSLLKTLEKADDIAFSISDLKQLYLEMFGEEIPYPYGEKEANPNAQKDTSMTGKAKRALKKAISVFRKD